MYERRSNEAAAEPRHVSASVESRCEATSFVRPTKHAKR